MNIINKSVPFLGYQDSIMKNNRKLFEKPLLFSANKQLDDQYLSKAIHRAYSPFSKKEQVSFSLSNRRDPFYYFLHRWMEKEVNYTKGFTFLAGILLNLYAAVKDIFWFIFGSTPLMAATRKFSTWGNEPDWEQVYTPEERKMSKLDKALYWLFFKNAKVPTEDEKDRVSWATKTPYQRRPRSHDP